MKNKITIAFFWGIVCVILVYLAAIIIPSLFSAESIRIEPAQPITYDDVLPVRGIALRDEVPILASGTPASVDYKVKDGDRVSIGDTVAIYNNENVSVSDRLAVELLDRQINLLNASISATSQYDLKTLDARTKDAITTYLNAGSERNLSAILDSSEEVLSYFIKRDIKANGDSSYYEAIRDNCKDAKSAILSGNAKQTYVYASYAGYFSSAYDGYEDLHSDDILNREGGIAPEDVYSLLAESPKPRPDNYIGKLQHYSFWNYLCVVPETEAERFPPGSTWTLLFQTVAGEQTDVKMTLVSSSRPVDGEVALVFESSFFNAQLYSLRICDAQIVLRSYSGFRVRKESIRVSEGDNGVYVLSGAKLVFKPVTVLYTSEDSGFAVVSGSSDQPSRMLILNDSVVIGGKDVYDGKVVNIN